MKRRLSFLTTAIVAVMLCPLALAGNNAELVRTFVCENTLYTYVDMAETNQPVTKAEARVGEQIFSAVGRMETVLQVGSPITYLLLLDNSTSMPEFRGEVNAFAQALTQTSGENTRYILATFGDDFVVRSEDVLADALADEIAAIPFDENVTRLHTAIDKALDYLDALPRQGNELRSVLILSDAVQYDPTGGIPYEELLERIGSSDTMLHVMGVGDDTEALDRLMRLATASGGTGWVLNQVSPEETAAQLAEYTGHFHVMGFDLTTGTFDGGNETVTVTFSSGGELLCKASDTVVIPAMDSSTESSAPQLPDDVPTEVGTSDASAIKPTQENTAISVWVIIAIAVLAIGIAFICVLFLRRKKLVAASDSIVRGVYMRLEILRGAALPEKTEFILSDELTIGKGCDISFDSNVASKCCARVFIADDGVYLESISSQDEICVNGLPIQTVALHSGDEITVGNVVFSLKF